MAPQVYSWTCSICSFAWVINAIAAYEQVTTITREEAASIIGYPQCVNEVYGLMSAQCMVDAFASLGFESTQAWVTFDQAYAIMSAHTGVINPTGMYHFMGIRGVSEGALWVANSALGYRGVYEVLGRDQFNALGPTQVIYLSETART